jgi:hypothetical protein
MKKTDNIDQMSNEKTPSPKPRKTPSQEDFSSTYIPWVCSGIGKKSKGLERGHEKGIWPYKLAFTENSKGTKQSYKKMMDLHCQFCVVHDKKEIRECSRCECTFWRYRTSKCRVHRAMLGGLKKGEILDSNELVELQELKESVQEAEVRVIAMATKHCKQKAGWFRKAYSGKSRSAAIKAEELYLANYDTAEVVPFDEWLDDEIRIWSEQNPVKGGK